MGIIQRQALRNTLINFIGAIIGGITRMILPLVVPGKSEYGLLNLVDTVSGVFVTFFHLGYITILHQLFPKYRDEENGHHGFLLLGIFMSLVGILLSFIIFYFFGENLLKDNDDLILFRRFSFLIFPIIFFRILFLNVESYTKMLYQTFVGTFLDTFLSKLFVVVSILIYVYFTISFDYFVYLYSLSFCIPGFVILFVAFSKTAKIVLPSKKLFILEERKKISEYVLFGVLIGASSSIIIYIDTLMVNKMVSMEMMGIYTLFFFAARFIMIPATSIARIAQVILADAWKEKDFKTINEVYQKSCINQLLIATFLFGLGWSILDPVLNLHIKYADFIPYQNIFLILGSGIIIEMATGVNTNIIAVSEYYKFNMYFNVVLAVLVIILNYFLIQKFSLEGAAWASVIAMTTVNFLRWIFLYKKYDLQPFNLKFLKALLFSLIFVFFILFVKFELNPYFKILLNVLVLSTVFWSVVIYFNLSDDVTKWAQKIKMKYLK